MWTRIRRLCRSNHYIGNLIINFIYLYNYVANCLSETVWNIQKYISEYEMQWNKKKIWYNVFPNVSLKNKQKMQSHLVIFWLCLTINYNNLINIAFLHITFFYGLPIAILLIYINCIKPFLKKIRFIDSVFQSNIVKNFTFCHIIVFIKTIFSTAFKITNSIQK